MIKITDVTGIGESKLQLTPEEDSQLERLGFTRLGCLSAQVQTSSFEQVIGVWKSPDGNAFAIPEGNQHGNETFCAFRSLLVGGALVETSNEPKSVTGFLVGRAGVTIPAADYHISYVEGVQLAEVWKHHQEHLSRRAAQTRKHRTMDAAVVLARHYAALASRKTILVGALFPCAILLSLGVNSLLPAAAPKWLTLATVYAPVLVAPLLLVPPLRRVLFSLPPRFFWPKAPPGSAE